MRIEETKVEGFDGIIRQMEMPNGTVIYGVQDSLVYKFTWFDNLTDAVCHGLVNYKQAVNYRKRKSASRDRFERIVALLEAHNSQLDCFA